MATFVVPTDETLTAFLEEVELDAVVYRLEFRYNKRDDAYYLSIFDAADNPLRLSIRIVEDWPLLRTWLTEGRPAGDLYCLTTGGITRPPTINEIATAFDFVYGGNA